VILDVLRAAGSDGLSPKEIHGKVRRYGLKYHHITRRIKRMNKRMQNEIGERVADKVGSARRNVTFKSTKLSG
jgi:hypothetical protein